MNFAKIAIFFTATIFCVQAAVTADAKVASTERLTKALSTLTSNSSPQAQKLAQVLKSFNMPSKEQLDLLAEKLRSIDMPSKEDIERATKALRSGQLAPSLRKATPEAASDISATSRVLDDDPGLLALIFLILKLLGVFP